MWLLLDGGNYRLKWTYYQENSLHTLTYTKNSDPEQKAKLEAQWLALERPERVLLCNVAGPALEIGLQQIITKLWNRPLEIFRSQKEACGVTNAYANPNQLGADRWAAWIGAHHHYKTALCVVGCGTAITLDFLTQQGSHLGGFIIPGLHLQLAALERSTQGITLQKKNWPKVPIALGCDTSACVENGVLYAVCALIEQKLAQLRKQKKQLFQLVLTGGDAKVVRQGLQVPATVDSYLIFRGLLRLANDL